MNNYSWNLSAFFLVISILSPAVLPLTSAQAASETVTNDRPVYSLGLKLLRKRQFKKAIEKFTTVIAEEPTGDSLQALALYHRGLAYQALGQLDQARNDYSRAIKVQTLNDKVLKVVYYNRGLVHDGLKRPNAALADFSSAIDRNPKFSPAYHNLGNVLRKMGRHKRAIKNFLKSLELGNPQPYLTYLGLAMAYEGIGRKKEAITSLKYALNVRPRFKKAHDMLARLTTEDIYTFPTGVASLPKTVPAVTGSIPKNTNQAEYVHKRTHVSSEFERLDKALRNLVKVKPEPKKFKKLTLRGSLSSPAIGRVAVVVPGPGLKTAQRRRHSTPVPRKRPRPEKRTQLGTFKAQLGISASQAKANKIWFFLHAQHRDLLQHLTPTFQRIDGGKGGVLYRIQVGPFKSWKAADHLCKVIKERAVNCFPVGNQS